MKRLRFNLIRLFPRSSELRTGNSRATLGRCWNGSLQPVTEERVEKVFTTQRKTFHPCCKLFHFRKQAFFASVTSTALKYVPIFLKDVRNLSKRKCGFAAGEEKVSGAPTTRARRRRAGRRRSASRRSRSTARPLARPRCPPPPRGKFWWRHSDFFRRTAPAHSGRDRCCAGTARSP